MNALWENFCRAWVNAELVTTLEDQVHELRTLKKSSSSVCTQHLTIFSINITILVRVKVALRVK